jgi:hypothetical protein
MLLGRVAAVLAGCGRRGFPGLLRMAAKAVDEDYAVES